MRKFASLLLVFVLLLAAVPVSAAGTPAITVGSATADVSGGVATVQVPISIENNPGFAGMDLSIAIPDGWKMENVKVKNGDQYSIFYKNEDGDMERVATPITNTANGSFIAAYGEGNITADGVICWVTYTVPATELNGATPISVTIEKINDIDDTATNMKGRFAVKAGTVTVTGASAEKPEEETKQPTDVEPQPVVEFSDVAGNWAEKYIKEAAERQLIEGYMGYYRPNDTMTRAEFVTILWRAMGRPQPTKKTTFKDLTQDWYKDAVAWAEENAVVNGMAEGVFAPNGNVTREQLVTILHRLAGTPTGMELMFTSIYDSQYPDSKSVGDWAKSAVYWSIYNGIYCGVGSEQVGKTLEPKVSADRAQIAVMIVRYLDLED